MWTADDHGTDAGGRVDEDYCKGCFHEGLFTQPRVSLDEMVRRMADRVSGLPRAEAIAKSRDILPRLKRWRDSTP